MEINENDWYPVRWPSDNNQLLVTASEHMASKEAQTSIAELRAAGHQVVYLHSSGGTEDMPWKCEMLWIDGQLYIGGNI